MLVAVLNSRYRRKELVLIRKDLGRKLGVTGEWMPIARFAIDGILRGFSKVGDLRSGWRHVAVI